MSSPRTATKSTGPKRTAKASSVKSPVRAKTPLASDAGISSRAKKLAADIERDLVEGRNEALTPEALQALMAALCKSYSAKVEAGQEIMPLRGRTIVSNTDIMTTASGLLKAANLAVFELGMWQSWTGR